MSQNKKRTLIFTDGASSGNPGPGGWGAILLKPDNTVTEIGGGEAHTTNNRMELSAAAQALEFLSKSEFWQGYPNIEIYTDSTYVIYGMTKWAHAWKRKGWMTSNQT